MSTSPQEQAHQIVMDAISQFDGVLDDPEGPSVEEQMFLAIEKAIAAALEDPRLEIYVQEAQPDWHIWYEHHKNPMKNCPRCEHLSRAAKEDAEQTSNPGEEEPHG